MGKYSNIDTDVFSIFATNAWKAENIKTFPSNFIAMNAGNEFIRVSIIPNGNGINIKSVSGILIIDIFTPAGNGPKRSSLIADKLDQYLVGKSITTQNQCITQFKASSFGFGSVDKDNPSLFRSSLTIPFNYFGVF